MKLFGLIVAGGSGSRMKSELPKQFMLLNKVPVLMHTINVFKQFNSQISILIVLPKNQIDTWKEMCAAYNFETEHTIVEGGDERFYSVKNGIDIIEEEGIVLIHDGVRPLVSKKTIRRCIETTMEKGNAIPAIPLIDSIRITDKNNNKAVDRSNFVAIQTPQTFYVSEIKEAYNFGFDNSFTDDATVLERLGKKINLVEGNVENIKITNPLDIKIAESLLP
ncbi:MAG: 2-C-methyl-D-erythritol 4-phosphate cytidylyltransferase [Prolixibacteraceae bacterium]|jgi:2-C-methyl-D-erythritol 4-phosphate cytidylyltransferase|nr:2-C-methyl-D-erythritol 4-phosphate cytidylyltransferase [Prolixibacteraceae bacterium]